MTCIVGVIKGETVYMGGDSASSNGSRLWSRTDEKVFINGPFIMGFTTSWRMGQLLRYTFRPPRHPAGMDDMKFMCTKFIDEVRTCFKEGAWSQNQSGQETGGTFLVGYRGKLYEVQSDFQVGLNLEEFASVGCGNEIAVGAMYATPDMEPEERIRTALSAAERFSEGVRAPFLILKHRVEGKRKRKK